MRIIAGSLKGRRMPAPPGTGKAGIRPTAAKVRGALFSILGGDLSGLSFLDLYAGSGGVGMEALSRGAAQVVFVEEHRALQRALQEMLDRMRGAFSGEARVSARPADAFVKTHEGPPFDVVFVDPPYQGGEAEKILPLLGAGDMIACAHGLEGQAGRVIVEHFHKTRLPDALGCLGVVKRYRYGDTLLSLYERT